MTAQTPPRTRTALFLLTLGVVSILLFPTSRAGPVSGGGDSTRTLTWSMSEPSGLSFNGTAVENGMAVLAWAPETLVWSGGSDFAANGTLGSSLFAGPSGVELRADTRNYVTGGDFAAPGAWQLLPTQNVSVVEGGSFEDAYIGHTSPAPPSLMFDSLDIVNPLWSSTASSGSACVFVWVTPDHDGSGSMIQCTILLGDLGGSFAGLEWPTDNWSAHDRLLLWVFADDPSDPPILKSWSFRLNATVASTEVSTTLQPLSPGWQEIVVDLTELGPNRDALTNIQFLVVGQSISDKKVFFDEIRLTTAKFFQETGRLRQAFTKPNVTNPSTGSANLEFDYLIADGFGVESFEFGVNFSGDDNSSSSSVPVINTGSWNRHSIDVSPIAAAAGPYSLEFSVRIAVDSIGASTAGVRIDNIRVEFPNRTAGSFLSEVVDLGLVSQFTALRWSGTIPLETAALLRARGGNEVNPNGPTWSAWDSWDTLGSYMPSWGPSRYLQIGLELSTMNATRTPLLNSVQLEVQHRSATGEIETSYELHGEDSFKTWTRMQVYTTDSGVGDISLLVDRGSGWEIVPADEALPQSNSKAISWRVVLSTPDGLGTPHVSSVVLTYQLATIADNVASVLLNPFVLAALTAVAMSGYAGHAVVRRRSFAVDDLFLVSREGRLMLHNTRRMRPDRDEDILSGMLTAILAFVKDSDPEGNGELHHFKVGDKTTVLEKGTYSYVAAVYSGQVPKWASKDLQRFLKDLEARFGNAFAQWSGDPEDLQGLREFTSRFVSRIRYRPWNLVAGKAA